MMNAQEVLPTSLSGGCVDILGLEFHNNDLESVNYGFKKIQYLGFEIYSRKEIQYLGFEN